ncbi:hypothetical protein H310_12720 [Aphanomyces invadans]|uniref:Lipoxygenase domain-containing protein n=1 Tax=Aphanomyces invadans TaxID=157072 RepID=A0A024TIW5_9STRA|nr:hypothetical protein H310_12720 [Aphanomyces invadans]ETV93292.1 hypothetical protein H310_12720 [Aphanomyces invadans]|eukprot:XP_008878127.1 hypothetical protein H310_12720 [Aphanomyces invadans]
MGNVTGHVQREREYVKTVIGFMKDPRTFMSASRNTYGDVFLFQSSLVNQKIAGLSGPEALQAFEARLADGSLVKTGALPSGVSDLLGPIMSVLDGEDHHRKKAGIMTAFTPQQLAKYLLVVRRIIQTEHARWAARGGVISITASSKELVFKLLLAVLYGIEGDFDEYRPLVDEFVASIRKSAVKASPEGKAARDTIMNDLVIPAIEAAKVRVAGGTPSPSALDHLVGLNQLADDDLGVEMFHVLFAGFGGLSCLATNLVTPLVTMPDVREKILDARDQFLSKYTGDTKWDHLEDLGYINQYILEVKRFFVAGPTQSFAKAAVAFDVVTSKGTFHIPKGCLVAAGLETTAFDAEVWPNPDNFDPSRFDNNDDLSALQFKLCPHGIGSTSNRRCAGETLTTLVCQALVVSLFDFTWNMVPGQDYELDENTSIPTPRGGLKAVGFRRRDAVTSYGVAGTDDDWTFLKLPEAKAIVSVHGGWGDSDGLFADPRLDLWTELMIKLIGKKQAKWNRPYADTALMLPKNKQPLVKLTLAQTSIQVPTEDEDWPTQSWVEVKQANFLRDHAPFKDDFVHKFLPGEDGERYVMSKVGHMWPRVNVHWNDRYSDRALELLVFNGLGSHLVQKLPTEDPTDGSYYGVLLNFMQVLDVRPGFAKYGADAFFDKQGKLIKIIRGDKTYTKTDVEWEYVKMCFRGSLQTKVTAVDHLLGIHVTVANYLVTASREQLAVNHPLRRLFKPFTFRTVSINFSAGRALFWPNGMLQRAYALTNSGMKQTWEYGLSHFVYAPFPDRVKAQQIDTFTLPFHQDGLDYWAIVFSFVSKYIDLYFADDAAIAGDTDVVNFWTYVTSVSPVPLPPVSKASLKDFIAQGIFLVSSMHNHLGTIAEYVSDPAFCPSAWVEGDHAAPPGNAVRLALIMTATGFTQPAITEDFSHVMLDNAAKDLVRTFTADLFKLIDVIDARNTTRVQPFQSFNPKTMEMAVSI